MAPPVLGVIFDNLSFKDRTSHFLRRYQLIFRIHLVDCVEGINDFFRRGFSNFSNDFRHRDCLLSSDGLRSDGHISELRPQASRKPSGQAFQLLGPHLRIKAFYGTSDNAVRTQVWIAVSVYVLVAILKKRLRLDVSLYTILQILSVTISEKTPLSLALSDSHMGYTEQIIANQLNLFE